MAQEQPLSVEEAFQVFEAAVTASSQDHPNLKEFFGIEDLSKSVKVFSQVAATAQENPDIKEIFNLSTRRSGAPFTLVSES